MNNIPLNNLENESYEEYLLRIGSNKDELDLSWKDVASLMNEFLNEDFTESKYRKEYHLLNRGITIGVKKSENNEYIQEIEDKTVQLQKERFKYQDQKREYTNLIRQQSRFEHLKEEVSRAIQELEKIKPLKFEHRSQLNSNKKGIVLWSDFHVGSEFKNSFNAYDIDVFRSRLKMLVEKTIQYSTKNEVSELIVANLGDALHGAIHVSARVQSGEDVIRQIQIAAESIAEALAEISKYHKKVKFINIIGNHSRLISNKHESIFRENLEYLIPWFLESRLSQFDNIEIVQDEDGLYIEDIDGEKHLFAHGDLDPASTSAKNLPQMLGFVPKYIYSGHIHHNYEKEFGKTEVIVNGSLMGPDDYAISKRYFASPMQKYIVLDGSDIECTYKIKF
ncbi:Calcineurin-like phosphoesterase superfamily domain protein [compost metagenome]